MASRGYSKSDLLGRYSCLNPEQGSLVLGGGGDGHGLSHLWEGLDFKVSALALTDWPPSQGGFQEDPGCTVL